MSKNVRLSDAAYARLAAHKREDETFSDVVLRLPGERSLLDLAGVLTDEQADALAAASTSAGNADVRRWKPAPSSSSEPVRGPPTMLLDTAFLIDLR